MIFQYDICAELTGLIRNRSSGFAEKVALKGIVLRVYEYERTLSRHLVGRYKNVLAEHGLNFDENLYTTAKKAFAPSRLKINAWADIRDTAAGHYEPDTDSQIAALESLQAGPVVDICNDFLAFNMAVTTMFQNTGNELLVKQAASQTPLKPS